MIHLLGPYLLAAALVGLGVFGIAVRRNAVLLLVGVELVLTLGTGMGAALFVNGHLVPNLELGHHPFEKGKTYEERVSDAALKRVGKKEWSKRVAGALAQLQPIFNYETLYLGGGNIASLKIKLPKNVRVFDNVDGMTGGIRLWDDQG